MGQRPAPSASRRQRDKITAKRTPRFLEAPSLRSEENQGKFFRSLTSFLATYNFDGVDIDWEYPRTEDRNGREEDFANFPIFIRNLKNALEATGGRNGLTLTLPASYWYLQHFDIIELVKYVDFFNIMSYDLHGPWEKGNIWTGEYLNAHTNLTEIDSALDLLWRNNIDPAKVVLGLAFYGRASTVANTNCVSPGGCQFASGARALRCSHEISIMLNSEIDQIITEKNLAPTLYANAAVKVISWDDQWVAYDDDETMALKVEFAKSLCLGGVMVWAISHDTTEAKYTRALSRVTSRSTQGGGIFLEQDPLKEVTGPPRTITIQQCRWTNCNENCPSGWQEMVDNATPSIFFSSSLFNTVIKDETACDGDGYHKFCCLVTSNPPTCRWTSQNNGKCEGSCPSGYTEVGSRSKYCEVQGQGQALCCTYDDTNQAIGSTALYGTCLWSQWPSCDSGSCPAGFPSLTSSTTKTEARFAIRGVMALCLDIGVPLRTKKRSTAAMFQIHRRSGRIAKFRRPVLHQKTRVSLDCYGPQCFGKGGAVPQCCTSGYVIDDPTDTTDEAALRNALTSFLDAPQCLDESVFGKRGNTDTSRLIYLELMLAKALGETVNAAAQGIVDEVLKSKGYTCSSISKYRAYKLGTYVLRSWSNNRLARLILCSAEYIDCLLCGTCRLCADGTCGGLLDPHTSTNLEAECSDSEDGDGSTMKTFVQKREEVQYGSHDISLQKRASRTQNNFPYVGKSGSIKYYEQQYTSGGQWDEYHSVYDSIFDYEDEKDCANPIIAHIGPIRLPILKPQPHFFQTEHIIEFQGMNTFFRYLSYRTIVPGTTLPVTPYDFFTLGFNSEIIPANSPLIIPIPYKQNPFANEQIPSDRIMDALGSTWNNRNFVLLRDTLNGMKKRLWAGHLPVADEKMQDAVNTDPSTAVSYIRRVIAVIHYLNSPIVMSCLINICNLIRQQLVMIEDV
ncbi:hypothetical protein V496_04149 [Pseudogymnoascus sp. VKM F-4515 (FW-2607)]|nr:hypothetical protein V496_04149 [Pseudogymnoascus sp. VKM F-4515 (FW-2607)]